VEREAFYQRMVWVIDARGWKLELKNRASKVDREGDILTFRWRWPHRTWAAAKAPMLLDTGCYLLEVGRIYWGRYVGGWARLDTVFNAPRVACVLS
jgi:hypothetical protein